MFAGVIPGDVWKTDIEVGGSRIQRDCAWGSVAGKAEAIERQHQARLRLRPSRCAILPSVRSLTVAGTNKVAGSRAASRGRNEFSHGRKSAADSTRFMQLASINAGDRKSSPPGSHA